MNRKTEEEILISYREGTATQEEKELVEGWILNGADFGFDLTDEELLEDLVSIRQRLNLQKEESKFPIWKSLAVAASIILISSLAIVLYKSNSQQPLEYTKHMVKDKVAAGNVATLTLSDGSTVRLDSTLKGVIKESGIEIANDARGNLTYVVKDNEGTNFSEAYNTISTPRGGTYKILLPDGSKVWLNAASSLRFPLSFVKNTRKVELTGEGYFEVAKSNKKFLVVANNAAVEVLGTHFNVNSYNNEASTNITLLEGSVKVLSSNATALLKPGEQGEVKAQGNVIRVRNDIDTESLIAWKEGSFKFSNTDLKAIMRQLERWYDIDVDESSIPDKKFNGTISRDVKLSEVLSMIELTSNLKFKIEGRSLKMK
jgi:ferric-dicitrate binding protein FerR (iron transport regulator)